MNEPEKKPAKIDPISVDDTSGITPASNEPALSDIKPAPAAANSNETKKEPVVGVTPVIDTGAKKDPVVVLPVTTVVPEAKSEPVIPAVVPQAPANNDNPVSAEKPAAPVVAPVAEKPADVAAPVAEGAKPAETPAAPAAQSRTKGFLKKAFNFASSAAVGAAVSLTVKSAVGAALGLAGAPVWLTIVATGLAVGVGATLLADAKHRNATKKQGGELSGYFSRAHGKELLSKRSLTTFGISTAGALLGSAIALGFHEGIIQNAWHNFWHHATPTPPVATIVAPVVIPEHVVTPPPVETVVAQPVVPVVAPIESVVHCIAPVDQFNTLISGHHVSAQVTDALHRAASSNAHIAAQGTKDLGFYAQNGIGGVPKDTHVALELFKKAADAGNAQARVDMLYLQHYGLDHVAVDKTSSLSAMKDIHTAKAGEFVKAWGGAGKTLPHVDFDSNTILKGLPVGCPVPG